MKNDLNSFLYSPILMDINRIILLLEYQSTLSDGFPTFESFERICLIEDTLHKLIENLGVTDELLASFKDIKSLQDDTSTPNFREIFGVK